VEGRWTDEDSRKQTRLESSSDIHEAHASNFYHLNREMRIPCLFGAWEALPFVASPILGDLNFASSKRVEEMASSNR